MRYLKGFETTARSIVEEKALRVDPKRGPAQIDKTLRSKADVDLQRGKLAVLEHYILPLVESDEPRILDVGCGLGAFVLLCLLEGHDAVGLDTAEAEIAFARARLAATIPGADVERRYVRCRTDELGREAPGSYNVVTMFSVLEHVPEWRSMLADIDALLRPGGYIVITCPNYAAVLYEDHFLLPWLPLAPRRLLRWWVATSGRGVDYFDTDMSLITYAGLRRWLGREHRVNEVFTLERALQEATGGSAGRSLLAWLHCHGMDAAARALLLMRYRMLPYAKKNNLVIAQKLC